MIKKILQRATVKVACLFVVSCASVSERQPFQVVPSTVSVGAPSALLALCESHQDLCGPSSSEEDKFPPLISDTPECDQKECQLSPSLAEQLDPVSTLKSSDTPKELQHSTGLQDETPIQVARIQNISGNSVRLNRHNHVREIDLSNATTLFHLLMARDSVNSDDYKKNETLFHSISYEHKNLIQKVNKNINKAIFPKEDIDHYGMGDKWYLPLSLSTSERPQGDCEDYALEKRAALLALGINPEAISLSVVFDKIIGLHAVLIIHTDKGDLVMDNLSMSLKRPEETRYDFLMVQRGADLSKWFIPYKSRINDDEPDVS